MIVSETLPPQTKQILQTVDGIINKTFPIPERFRRRLPPTIAELSKLLTSQRGDRSLSYLGRPGFLSAYLHYFLPWNLYRLCILLHHTEITLKSGDTITDFGSGTLTFASALWIARPELRSIPLEINCIDRSAAAMEAGNKFFNALCTAAGENNTAWKINIIKKDIDFRKTNTVYIKNKAALVCAVNIFNEIYENIPHTNTEGLKRIAVNAAQIMHNHAAESGSILTVEPGVPQSGHFISFLRGAFLEMGHTPLSPCTHAEKCPCSGGRQKRWCHFAFETTDAPKELHRLSASAGIPKERLVLSFLLTSLPSKQMPRKNQSSNTTQIRVISDPFPLPDNRFGRYGCCEHGLILLSGNKNRIEKIASLSCIKSAFTPKARDKKSGAYIMEIL